jgi:hypothetical protein
MALIEIDVSAGNCLPDRFELRPAFGTSSRTPTVVGDLSDRRIAEFGEVREGVRD